MAILDFSHSLNRSKSRSGGFTLVEMLISISLIVILSGVAALYSQDVNKYILLATKKGELINIFFRARNLSQSYIADPPSGKVICSYGVHIGGGPAGSPDVFIFDDLVSAGDSCETSNNQYDSGDRIRTGELDRFYLTRNFSFLEYTLNDMVFIPPDPLVKINDDEDSSAYVRVYYLGDSDAKFGISVTSAGQISYE